MVYTLGELADAIGASLQGDADCKISGVATLSGATTGHISFLSNKLYRKYLAESSASAVILSANESSSCPIENQLLMENPYYGFCQTISLFHPPMKKTGAIHPSAVVADSATLDPSVYVGEQVVIAEGVTIGANTILLPGVVVGEQVSIGEDCLIHSNVVLERNVQLANRVILHPGVVIGADGFGLAQHQGKWNKIPQIGSVILEDDVEVGANSTIDRGAIEDTIIKAGVKIDNQIQIGHNCYIGEDTAIAACTGISGSTTIGKRCMIGGGSGFNGHLTITDDVTFTGFSMVTKSIQNPGVYSSGIPLKDNLTWRKNVARFNRLQDMEEKIKRLEKKLSDDISS